MTHAENEQSKLDGQIEPPTGARVRVVADTKEVVHLILQLCPDELSAEQLNQVAGGGREKDPWRSRTGEVSR